MSAPETLEELMAQALVMEREAAARYAELADMMEVHNNLEVAALFRKLAEIEGRHAAQIESGLGRTEERPAVVSASGSWATVEPPENVPVDDVHYLMHPWHALQLALAAEQRAVNFFDALARTTTADAIRRAAEEMRAEELEHVQWVQQWLARVVRPGDDWAADPDPARHVD